METNSGTGLAVFTGAASAIIIYQASKHICPEERKQFGYNVAYLSCGAIFGFGLYHILKVTFNK